MTLALLVLTGVAALVDWVAVARRQHRLELAAKPLTLVLLLAAAATADLGPAKPWVLAALALGLAGDVALMFSPYDDGPGSSDGVPDGGPDGVPDGAAIDGAFLLGLAAFLAGHVAYLVAFSRHGLHTAQVIAGLLVVAGSSAFTLPRVLGATRRRGGRELTAVVGLYAAALGAMAALAVGTGSLATAAGGLLFLASDTVLAWNRFVRPTARGPLAVIVTYHLAQVLIVVGLLR